MLIFKESGRLGNQLFQYAALKTLRPEENELILLGFEALQSVFDGIDAKVVNSDSSRLERSLYYRLYHYSASLARKGIVSEIRESRDSPKLIESRGLLKNVHFVEESYFQGEAFFDSSSITSLSLKPELLDSAKRIIELTAQGKTPIFIHIRRGDYLIWPSKTSPAILPASYYQKCIDIVCARISNPFFIFASDDYYYVKDVFGGLDSSYISSKSALEDFALMTQCDGGILSASSFSWWAAYFAKTQSSSKLFIAPKYWAGHAEQVWYPAFIESKFLTYITV